ncbi:VOC family protein [Paenibacillus antri]|uniref:VOC family protein n=2 Tax=Paenibacillus antri TaxID=2582848 RepID=A0A5R9G4I2_9BACL|nr:VOC family protein [Paenibacillus antri]
MVKNMDESIRFYTEIIGMNLDRRVALNDEVELAFLTFPGQESVEVELVGRFDGKLSADGIVNHLAFTVDDIEAEIARLQAAGVSMIDTAPRVILNGIQIAFFYGPNGEKLELFQKP